MVSRWIQTIIPLIVVLGFVSLSSTSRAQGVDTYIEPRDISIGETLEYVVETKEDTRRIVPPESDDFEVVGQSTRTNVRIINGDITRQMSYRFRLAPRNSGNLSTGAARIELADGTTVRGTSFDVSVSDSPSASPRGTITGSGRSAPVRPRRSHPGNPAVPSRSAPTKTTDASASLPRIPPPGSSEMFSSGIPADVGNAPFIVSAVSDDQPYVGEQLMVDYLFFSPVTGFGMTPEGLNEPSFSDFWFQNMTEGRRNGGGSMLGTERVRGRLYEVHLIRSFLLLPLEPGELLVPAIELEISDSTFFRRRGTKTLASPTLKLDVRELPEEGRPSGFRPGNVGRFSISTNLEDSQLRVGDTGRLQVRIEGVGISSRIVPPDVSLPDGLRQFDPEDSVEDSRSRKGWMEAHVQRTIPFTPRREGSFEFEDVAFHYFDPWKEEYETVTASSASLLVEGSRPGAIPNQDSDEAREDREADWLSALPGERRVRKKGRVFSRLEPFPASMGFYSLLAVPFLLVGGTAALRKFRAHREETAPDRKRAHAGKRTRKALKDLDPEDRESFSTMARLLRDFVTTKTGEACRGATIERVRNVAGQHFGRPGFQIGNLIEQAERARYGAAEDIDFASLRGDALKVLNEAQLTDPTEEAKA